MGEVKIPAVLLLKDVALLAIVFLAVSLVVFFLRRSSWKKHKQWAVQNDWTWTLRPRGGWTESWKPDYMFTKILDGRRVSVAQSSMGNGEDSLVLTIVCAELRRPLPDTSVAPRGGMSRMARKILGPSEMATANPDFDRQFHIVTASPGTLSHWFGPALIEAQVAGHLPAMWTVQGTEVMLRWSGGLVPQKTPDHARSILALADLLDMSSAEPPSNVPPAPPGSTAADDRG
ncbi:hypothetical protein ACWKSP_21895 [Micromonosporaceae bacterium Da 78-11]